MNMHTARVYPAVLATRQVGEVSWYQAPVKRLWIALALVALAAASVWFWAPKDVVQGNSAPVDTAVAAVQPASRASATSPAERDVPRVVAKRRVDAKQREAYLRRIAAGADRRGAAGDTRKRDAEHDAGGPPAAVAHEAEDGAEPHPLTDRTGGELSDLMDALSKDLMPLADECYEAAVERDPSIAGMIDINIEMVGDQDVGGIVESFELGEENEIRDAEMIECNRETTLSTIFPAPEDSGRRGARLTLTFEPERADADS